MNVKLYNIYDPNDYIIMKDNHIVYINESNFEYDCNKKFLYYVNNLRKYNKEIPNRMKLYLSSIVFRNTPLSMLNVIKSTYGKKHDLQNDVSRIRSRYQKLKAIEQL